MPSPLPHAPTIGAARRPGPLTEAGRLLALAVPLVVGLSASTLIGVTDTIMLAPLGSTALAAVSLTMSASVILYATIYGFISVVGVGIARGHGAGDSRAVSGAMRAGLKLGAAVGIGGAALMALALPLLPFLDQPGEVLAILPGYWLAMAAFLVPFSILLVFKALFDSIDRPWTGVAVAFFGVGLNVPLNYALIHGVAGLPGLGLLGAGIASVLAETIAAIVAALYWRRARSLRGARLRARARRPRLGAQMRDGAPVGVGYFAETVSYALAGLMIGWFGVAALAANQVVNAVGSLLYMLPLGMAAAVAIRIGQAAGGGETGRLRPIATAALAIVTGWMLIVTAALVLFGGTIAASLSADPEVIALATALFAIVALMQVADGLQSTALGALRGMLDTRIPMVVTLLAYWLLALPAAYLLAVPMALGAQGVWIGYGVGLAFAAVALPIRFYRLTAGGQPQGRTG
jgi:MATE family multidrug resistance protein